MRQRLLRYLGITELTAEMTDQFNEAILANALTHQKLEAIAKQLNETQLAVADLREKLDLDPMVSARDLDDLRVPAGDPMLGS